MAKRALIRKNAKRLVKELELDGKTEARVLQGLELIPMTEVLEKVPGKTVAQKADSCGVTRQTYYNWLRNEFRPSLSQAQVIAKITGIALDRIILL
jgi:transcriptional regulator with XRE-family HTH domain